MSKEDPATLTGADGTTTEGKEPDTLAKMRERAHAPRNDAMSIILERRRAEALVDAEANGFPTEFLKTPEIKSPIETTSLSDDDAAKAQAKADADAAAAETKKQADAQTTDELLDTELFKGKKVKVKIDGEEQLVDASRLIAEFQKGGAADKRLAAAVEKDRQAEERLRQAEARAAVPAKKDEDQEKKDKEAADKKAAEMARISKAYHSAVYQGNEAEAEKLFQEALDARIDIRIAERGPAATPTDQDDLVERTTQAIQHRLSVKSALDKAATDYPQIVSDTDFQQLVAARITEKRKDKDDTKIPQHVTDAYTEVAEKFGLKPASASDSGRPEVKVPPTRDAKRAAKEEIDSVPSASARASKEAPRQETVSEVIARIAAARSPVRV